MMSFEPTRKRLLAPAVAAIAVATLVCGRLAPARAQSCIPGPLFSGNLELAVPFYGPWARRAFSIVTGDFDRDGNPDIITGHDVGAALLFWRGHGDWTFDTPVLIPLPFAVPDITDGTAIKALATADLNADDKLDLVVGDEQSSGMATQRVHVMLGNGDGTFQTPTPWGPNIQFPRSIAVADFDGDDYLDVICATRQTWATFLWGAGDGSLPTFSQAGSGSFADHVAAADIDRDGDIDAVVAYTQTYPQILRNNGLGTFTIEPLGGGFGHAFAEMNGDDWPDLVFATMSGQNDASVHVDLNDQTGHFPVDVRFPVTSQVFQTPPIGDPLVVDLDGDGRSEVIVERGYYNTPMSNSDQFLVFHNAGDGTLEPFKVYHAGFPPAGSSDKFASADFNRDGHPDLAITAYTGLSILLNDGAGGLLTDRRVPWCESVVPPPEDIRSVTTFSTLTSADVNSDGRLDLVGIRRRSSPPPTTYHCAVLVQDAQGTLTDVRIIALPQQPVSIAVADFNGDMKLDVIFNFEEGTTGNGRGVALGNGDGTFGSMTFTPGAPVWPGSVFGAPKLIAADFDGDGRIDQSECNTDDEIGAITIRMRGSNGVLGPKIVYGSGIHTKALFAYDFDGDGRLDIGSPTEDSTDADTTDHIGFSILFNRTCRPLGDVNCDNSTDFLDIDAFVLALLDSAAYLATYPNCNVVLAADLNGDGEVNSLDIQLFVGGQLISPMTGACCMPSGPPYCEQRTAAYCAIVGGTYRGDGTTCATANCSGACCHPETGSCVDVSAGACVNWGGTYNGDGSTCETTSCPVGACCSLNNGSCTLTTEAYCTSTVGIYQGDDTLCGQTPCPFGRYQNEVNPIQYYVPGGLAQYLIDDMTLAGSGARELKSFNLAVYGGNSGGGSFDVWVDLTDGCFGTFIDGAYFLFEDVPDDGFAYVLSIDPVDPGITLPDTVWMGAFFSTEESGWIIANEAEIGSTEDRIFADTKFQCDTTLACCYAGLWANLTCVPGGGALMSDVGTRMSDVKTVHPPSAIAHPTLSTSHIERNGKRYRLGRVTKMEGVAAPVAVERQP